MNGVWGDSVSAMEAAPEFTPISGPEAISRLPASIRVGPFDFAINKWAPDEAYEARRWGEFSSLQQRICIQTNMPTAVKAVDTLLHEIMHAAYWAYNIHDEDKEERTVATLATAHVQIFRDNPWLLTWIGEALQR